MAKTTPLFRTSFVPLKSLTQKMLMTHFPRDWALACSVTDTCKDARKEAIFDLASAGVRGLDLQSGKVITWPSLAQALADAFGGGSTLVRGFPGRGGYRQVNLKNEAPKTVKEVTQKIRTAMKASGYKSQGRGMMATREISDGELGYYVQRGLGDRPAMVVINLGGTAKKPFLTIMS